MELDTLLAPVPGDLPCGEDLSFSPEFDAIQEARRADDPSLDQGDWITDLKTADWPLVAQSCERLLATRSKDLRLAVWWCEARTRVDGFQGLAHGLQLVAELCSRHWEGLHPVGEDDGHEQRVGNLSWLLAGAVRWSSEVAIVAAGDLRFGYADLEAARHRAVQAGREDSSAVDDAAGRPTLERLERARHDTPHRFYVELSQVLPECLVALDRLERSVDARLGHDGPSFSTLRDTLVTVQAQVARFAADAGVIGSPDAQALAAVGAAAGAPEADPATHVAGAERSGTICSRREALLQLRRVAEFFRNSEPHSPVAYLADKAARWGEMPLHVWLGSVVKDEVALAQLNEMLDVVPGGETTS